MPTLLETQAAMRESLLHRDSHPAAAMLAGNVPADRLDVYRNTFVHTLTRALRLCFPATARLVGADFFEGAAHVFISAHPPRAAWLDQYGGEFPDFLRSFPPAVSIAYLGDVAELDWAVNCALHATDAAPLDLAALGAIEAKDQGRVCFVADPSIRLLRLEYPADVIWRAVLDSDGDALGKIDLDSGPINILAERRPTGVEAERLDERPWRFLRKLCAGASIETALAAAGASDCAAALAEHLALGRFTAFALAPQGIADTSQGNTA
jgi:hypothetical protein